MISEKRLDQALGYLLKTDDELARLLEVMDTAVAKAEAVMDAVFVHLEGSVANREAHARMTTEYQKALAESFAAKRAHNAVLNKRKTESIVIDVWRSLNAARRQGNI